MLEELEALAAAVRRLKLLHCRCTGRQRLGSGRKGWPSRTGEGATTACMVQGAWMLKGAH